ncbi:phage minor capsid protein [Alteribacter populi]|uniref:phage minor capsid protein n=1 Tax=Alteribacter populi TaxID=2011011 RepID=UPI0012FF7278|nr:phage minor capsid protein [Alteribacter populi]
MRRVNEILGGLDANLSAEIDNAIDDIYEHGRARTLIALGLFASMGAARRYLRSDDVIESRTHRTWKTSQKDVTTEDLLAMTSNTRRRVKSEVRRVAAEVLREEYSTAVNRRVMTQRLERAGMHAITDSAGRRWKMSHYADVVMKTKMVEAHREAGEIEARERGAGYVVISQHGGSCKKCVPWEGRVLRINDSIEGTQPTVDEARNFGLYHPGCLHSQVVIRDPNIIR